MQSPSDGSATVTAAERWLRGTVLLLPAVLAFAGWWKLRALLYHIHWQRGPTIFALLLLSITLVVTVPAVARMVGRNLGASVSVAAVTGAGGTEREGAAARAHSERTRPGRHAWLVGALLLAAALAAASDDLRELRRGLSSDQPHLLDIGANTWAAAVHLFDLGENPYTHRSQLHRVDGDHGVTVDGGRVTMFGVPYDYGYPYFPAMFLSYAPFRWIDPGQRSILLGNVWWLFALAVGVGWLAYRLAPAGVGPPAAGLAVLLLAVSEGLGDQLFRFGITDIVIAVYALCSLVALSYRRPLAAGAFMGLAFSAKILPGLLLVAVLFAWLARRGGLRRAVAGFALVAAVVLVPFVLWNPAGFFSATILFYLTHHAGGDTTSLWYYLPQILRLPFLVVGGLLVGAVVAMPLASSGDDQRQLVRAAVIACFLFLAFNKMVHLNYQFAVVPLGCAGLAADALSVVGSRPRASRPHPRSAPA